MAVYIQTALFPAKCIQASGNWDLNSQPLAAKIQDFIQRVESAGIVTQKYCYSWACLPCWGKEQQCIFPLAKMTYFLGKSASGEMPQFLYGFLGICAWILLNSRYWSQTELSQYFCPHVSVPGLLYILPYFPPPCVLSGLSTSQKYSLWVYLNCPNLSVRCRTPSTTTDI